MKTFTNEQNARKLIAKLSLVKNGMICEWGNADLSVWVVKLINGVWEVSFNDNKKELVNVILN